MISVVVPCLGVSHSWKGVWPGTATAQQPVNVVLSPPNVRVVTGQLPPKQTAWSPVIPGGGVGFRPFEAGGAFRGKSSNQSGQAGNMDVKNLID